MKRLLLTLLVLLALSACMPPPLDLVPPETLAAQTMAAMPRTDTPLPTATPPPPPTATEPMGPVTPTLDLTIPGAYCLPTNTQRAQALVTRILDGGSIEVLSQNRTFRVRYIGLDVPQVVAPAEWQGPQSLSYNQSLVQGRPVTLVSDAVDIDPQGYYLRYVLIPGAFVNYDIVRHGFANFVSSPPNIACDNSLLAAQVEAQTTVAGVWMPTPVPTYTITPTPTITLTPTNTVPATSTRVPVCNCTARRLTCNSFGSQNQAQRCFEYCKDQGFGDIFGLDKNGNGLACEGMD